MSFEIEYVKKSWLALAPKMAASGSAGCDLFAAEDKVNKPQWTELVCVHLEMEISSGYYGHILPKSRLARYHFIDVEGGVIDSDFWAEMIVMFNHSNKPYEVTVVDRILQIVFHRYEVQSFLRCDELSRTDRGLGGFGSSGTSKFVTYF